MNDPSDPLGLREDAPLFAAWLASRAADVAPFTTPGHKRRH
jgi:hypothetical protein